MMETLVDKSEKECADKDGQFNKCCLVQLKVVYLIEKDVQYNFPSKNRINVAVKGSN